MDYEKLGLKMGLEIHQQLPGKKLFCDCTAVIKDSKPEFSFHRKLRAVIGETGEIDSAAAHEMSKGKTFTYQGYHDVNCLVDTDEEPPHNVNPEALETALIVAQLLNCKIVDEVQVMRKTVIDGSNVSGFQRTSLVAYGGYIETSLGKVGIDSVCLEEESAKVVKRSATEDIYNISRLGIPLVEIATGPDIKTPEHAKECAEKLGMILRSTKRVARGLGTIRQDVNLSIKGGTRVELKGFQEIKSIPKVAIGEIERQLKLIKQKKKLQKEVRKANPDGTSDFLRPMPGAARMYPETDVVPVKPDKIEHGVELIEEQVKRVQKLGLGEDLAKLIAKQHKVEVFEGFVKKFKNLKASFIAETMLPKLREIKRKYNVDTDSISDKKLEEVFAKINDGSVSKDGLDEILVAIAKGKKVDYSKYKAVSTKDLEKELKKLIDKNKGAPFGALMGKAMAHFKGKADGKVVSELLKKLAK